MRTGTQGYEETSPILETSYRLQKELWLRRLTAAKSQHEAALAHFREVLEATAANGAPPPDSWEAVLLARFAEATALSEYMDALRVYSELARGSSYS